MVNIIYCLLNILLNIFSGYCIADLIMGIFHWIKDTYFSPFTPIIGKRFIWGSRLHHIRPRHVIEFGSWELLTDSAKWTLLWMGPLFYLMGPSYFLFSLFTWISLNDVIHKYAHMYDTERPLWATFLQDIWVFQSHNEHHLHHITPHEINYCPISPYLNVIVERIDLWKKLEYIIEAALGVKPRSREIDFVEDLDYPANIRFIE